MINSSTTFESSINNLLEHLQKKHWANPIIKLANNFNLIPDDQLDECPRFDHQIINMLHQLKEAIAADPSTPLEQLAAIRLSALECWTLRIFREGANGRRYLDPLNATAIDFKGAKVSVLQSNTAFPAIDIIRRWARENLQ